MESDKIITLACMSLIMPFIVCSQSVNFTSGKPYDHGLQTVIPSDFVSGEFTMELWVLPDTSFPIGTTIPDGNKILYWSSEDPVPYSSNNWWFEGNFLLDGHNNNNRRKGTFSLQFYGGGRIRWSFGDDGVRGSGGHWAVQAYPASTTPSLLDGNWHHIALVRRWSGETYADLELWIDGNLVATETSYLRTDMRSYWDNWTYYPSNQRNWMWGAEKFAGQGGLWEDYKGLLDEIRYWNYAKTTSELVNDYSGRVTGDETGLVGWYPINEGSGLKLSDQLSVDGNVDLINMPDPYWYQDNAPLTGDQNEKPVAVDDTAELEEDTQIIINVLQNDYDPDAGTLRIETISHASLGTLSLGNKIPL